MCVYESRVRGVTLCVCMYPSEKQRSVLQDYGLGVWRCTNSNPGLLRKSGMILEKPFDPFKLLGFFAF